MNRHQHCLCLGPHKKKMKNWRVFQHTLGPSTFDGYHYTEVGCLRCNCRWRTRSRYAERLEVYKDVVEIAGG